MGPWEQRVISLYTRLRTGKWAPEWCAGIPATFRDYATYAKSPARASWADQWVHPLLHHFLQPTFLAPLTEHFEADGTRRWTSALDGASPLPVILGWLR
jgi:hypothetical protein